ncbi:MAG: hypothetical protein J6L83_05485 [Clostridia bacterium]|nr:hypothetical protein [Clostridia bacterium]
MLTFSSLKNQSDKSKGNSGEKNQGGFWGGLGYFGQSLLAGIGNIGEGAIDAILAPLADLTGNHEFAESLFKKNWVGDWYSDVTEDFNPGTGWEFAGNVAHGLGQSAYLFIPYAGAPIFFSGVMAQGISSAAQQTGDVGVKEAAYGLTTGAVEGALEYVGGAAAKGAKTLFKSGAKSAVKSTVRKGLVKQVLSDAASEFTEEAMSEVIDVGLQRLYGVNPNAELSLKDVLYAGAVGAVSGAVTTTAVQVPINMKNRARGEKIIKDGNSQTLVNTATSIADRIAAQGTDWDKAPEWAAAIRGQVDAYEKLSAGEKTGIRGQTLLGEMQSSLFFAEHQSVFNEVQKNIQNADEQSRATWAEYINKSVSKERRNNRDFTAEDVKNNTDNVAWQLAVYRYVPAMFNLDAAVVDLDTAQESGIGKVIDSAQNGMIDDSLENTRFDIDTELINFYRDVSSMKDLNAKSKRKKNLGVISQSHANLISGIIQKETGKKMDLSGYELWIDGSAIQHIEERHGKNGAKDQSMQDEKDVSRITWVANNADKAEVLRRADGSLDVDYRWQNRDQSPSVKVKLSSQIDNSTFYVVECVPDSENRRLHVESAYIQKNSGKGQQLNIGSENPPQHTSETLIDSDATTNRISQNNPVVNPEAEEISSNKAIDEKGDNSRSEAIEVKGEQTSAETVQDKTAGASPRPTGEFGGQGEVIDGATSSSTVSDGPPSPLEKADLDRAKRDAERMIEWEKKNAPTAEELNVVREYVKGFDSLPADRQLAIVRMIRSSKGVDADMVRGVANLMAITNRKGEVLAPDLEFRFAELADGVAKRGIKTEVGGKTVIVLNTNSTYKNTIRGSIAHEIVHYLENRKGYKALADFAMKHAKAEKVAEVTKTYTDYYRRVYTSELMGGDSVHGEKYDIVNLDNGMQYVLATENKVLSGNDSKKWAQQVANYINSVIRGGTDFTIKTTQGDYLTITRDTAYKAGDRNQVKNPDGTYRTMTDEEYKVKLNAEVHINELSEVSRKSNKPITPDYKRHKFAKDGFTYRRAYFKDFDGKYYQITISVGENGNVSTVYNVGKIKEDTLPSGKIVSTFSGSKANNVSSKDSIHQKNDLVNTSGQKNHLTELDNIPAEIKAEVERRLASDEFKALIDSEVTASVVGEMLNSEKFLKRYAQMGEEQGSVIKRIARFVKGIANSLKDKDKKASAVATDMMNLVDKALGSEVAGEKTGEKYEIKYPNFKDEDIEHNIKTVASMKSIITISEDKLKTTGKAPSVLYEEYFKSLGENIYSETYGDIAVRKSSVKSEIRHGNTAEKIASMEAIPSVIEKGKVISKYNKGAGVERLVIGAPITIGETDYLMGVMLQRDAQNQRLYLHNVILKEKTINSQEVDLLTTGTYDENDRLFITSILQKVLSVNTSDEKSFDDEAKIYDNRVIEIEELTVVDRVGHQEVKTSSDSTSSAVSSKYIIAKFREFVKNNDEKKSLTNSDIKNSTEQYDLDPEAVEEQKKKTTTKAEPKGIKTGSAEAGRFAVGLRKEFGLNKAAEETIRSKLESLEDVFIKGDREAYVEEYKKRVEEIFDIVFREGSFEVTTDNSYQGFQTYMRGKRFRVDKRFRQNMGKEEWKGVYSIIRGRLASDKNTAAPHVDSLYAELNELFPDLFSSEIINVHDQLERIAKVMLDAKNAQSEVFDYSQLPEEWQSSIAAEVIDRINSFITRVSSNRDSLKIIKAERNELLKMLKRERSMREKMAREEANAAKAERARIFTKKAVAPAVEEIESLTDEQVRSLAKGYELEGMSVAQKDRIISDIYIALHEASAEGEAGPGSVAVKGIATRIAWDMVQSAKIRGEDGKYYHLIDIYDEASVQAIASEYADVLYERFANMGEHTKYSYFAAEINAAEEEFRRDRIDDNAIHKLSREVSYQGQQLRRLVETQKRGMEDEGIQKVTKILAAVVNAKGNIVTSKVDEAIGEADRFFNMESGRLDSQSQAQEGSALTEFAYSSDANLKFMIDEFKRLRARVDKRGKDRTGKFLDAQEMRLLGKILAGIRKTVTEYNKVFINERYVDIDKVASDGATDIVEYYSLDKKAKTKVGELFNTLMRGVRQSYFYNVLTPETTIEALEGFKIGGVLKTLYHDVRIHKQKAEHLAVQMKKPFADYLDSKENVWTDTDGKKHSFRDKLNKKMINYNGAELTLGEAIYLYMLTKRKLTHSGLKENGYIVYDENNQRRLKLKIEDVENVRNEIGNQLDDADKAFLKMAEEFFNKTSTEVKNEADMRIFGYTNIEDGYYVPMIRDRYSRMQGVTDQRQSVGSIITVYNKSFNQNTIENAKALEGKNIMSIINDHADGLADYSELYIPLKSFDRVYNKAVTVNGETRSIREILNDEVWNKTGSYLRDLFADIQGQNRKSDNVIDSMVGKLRSAWVNSVLGLNLKVVATQTTSFVAANQVIEAKYLMPAMKKFFGNQSELGARADKYSDIIEPRSFEMGALRAQGNIDKVMEWSSKTGFMINLMDRRVCLAVFHAAELKAQAQGAGAVGTVENAKAAAKIADEAIYTTQAMTSASERSALQRSKSEIARTLSMFTSDSVKNLSHFVGNIMKYQAHKARAKSDLASKSQYEAELKKDARAIRRSAKTLVMTGVMLGLITQAFKYLYAKEEEEPEEKAKDLATDVISSTFNILPGVSDIIDKFVFDYDLSLNVFDVANDTIEDTASLMNMAGRAMAGEYVSGDKVFKNVFNFVKTVGAAFGAPIAPVERTVTGLLRRFFPSAIYGYDAMMSNPSYSADLRAAVEDGDEELAEHILETIYKNEATGVYSTPELEEVARLYGLGNTGVIPQKIGTTVNDVTLDRKQRAKFEKIYGEASAKVNELIRSEYYAELGDEQRAKAIKNLYSLYYNRAAAEVAGVEWSNAQAYSRLTDNYTALFAAQAYKSGLKPYKTLRGKEVSVKDQFVDYVENLRLSDADKLVVLYANGYRDAATKKKMLAYINALSISEDEKAKIAERLGFAVENGKVVEKKEELEIRAD